MNNETFYTVLIESEETKDESFVQVFWIWANSIGHAISDITSYALQAGIKKPFAREMDPYNIESASLKSIRRGFHHWHYSPKGSFTRKDLISFLKGNGFSLWKEIQANKAN